MRTVRDTAAKRIWPLVDEALNHDELRAIVREERLYEYQGSQDVRSLNGLAQKLRLAITITRVENADSTVNPRFRLAFTSENAHQAETVARRLVQLIVRNNDRTAKAPDVPVFETVTAPARAIAVRRNEQPAVLASGAAAGLIIGMIAGWVRIRGRSLRPVAGAEYS